MRAPITGVPRRDRQCGWRPVALDYIASRTKALIYRLRYDAAPAIEARIEQRPAPEYLVKPRPFATLVAEAEIGADDYEQLRDQGSPRRPAPAKRVARCDGQERLASRAGLNSTARRRDRALAERRGPKASNPCACVGCSLGSRKMGSTQRRCSANLRGRGRQPATLAGCLVEVRSRRVLGLHALTATGANDGDAKETRLPAPEAPLLTCLDREAGSGQADRKHHIDGHR